MNLDADSCYRALLARDRRFDGLFFVGVKTTGVYCRPVCPARTPGRRRCEFFARAAEAERSGFRACFRCRPELAPGLAAVDSVPRLVWSAAARIEAGFLNERSVEELARSLGVTSRHLRRALESELGVGPVELAETRRLALAKQLLHDTALPLADVAFASGFTSVRRFNALFRERFALAPSALRKGHGSGENRDAITLRLDFRAPFDWTRLLSFLAGRAIPGVEEVEGGVYRRTAALGGKSGLLEVRLDESRPALRASVPLSLATHLMEIALRLRRQFDLDAEPEAVGELLGRDERLRASVAAHPGLRVPGAFDGFETTVRAILGQQVSVRAATTLSGRLVARFGAELRPEGASSAGAWRLFPPAGVLAEAPVSAIAAVGLPAARAASVRELARAVRDGTVDLGPGAPPEATIAALTALPGIGPWTAQYVAMRALRFPNAFPGGDLAVRKALGVKTTREAEERARLWEPWRAYAVMHLWSSLSEGG